MKKEGPARSSPERAAIQVDVSAAYRECNNCDRKLDQIKETVTLNANTSKEYQVECKSNMITLCESAFGQLKVVGVDPYPNNNVHYLPH